MPSPEVMHAPSPAPRQREPERRPAAWRLADAHLAPLPLDERFRDRQTNAAADADRGAARRVAAVEAVEDGLALADRNAGPRVVHFDAHAVGRRVHDDGHSTTGRRVA